MVVVMVVVGMVFNGHVVAVVVVMVPIVVVLVNDRCFILESVNNL